MTSFRGRNLVRENLVVILECLVVKIGHLVVILSGLVVKNRGLVVIVKKWKFWREVSPLEKAFGGGPKPVIKVLGSMVLDLVVILESLVVKMEHLVVI